MEEVGEFLGIVGLIMMAAAVVSGALMKWRRIPMFRLHRLIGYVAAALAISHGVLMMISD